MRPGTFYSRYLQIPYLSFFLSAHVVERGEEDKAPLSRPHVFNWTHLPAQGPLFIL